MALSIYMEPTDRESKRRGNPYPQPLDTWDRKPDCASSRRRRPFVPSHLAASAVQTLARPLAAERDYAKIHREQHEQAVTVAVATLDDKLGQEPFTPTRAQPCAHMRERGVYVSDVTHNGLPVVYSVKSNHDVAQWTPWYEGHALETIQRDLWRYLNAVDPVEILAAISALPPALF